jgi:hypothetical protein
MSSPYNPNVPQPNQTLAQTHLPILTNFTEINNQFSVDHVALTAATNRGMHKQVELSQVSAAPGLAFPLSGIYAKHTGANPNRYTNLYFQSKPENAVLATEFPLNPIKAWVRFNAATLAIADSFNVTSVTLGIPGWSINFTNALQNTNYCVFITTNHNALLQTNIVSTTQTAATIILSASPTIVCAVIIGS